MARSPVCLDANVIMALVTVERFSQMAFSLWQEMVSQHQQPIAPVLLLCEVSSALRGKAARGEMALADVRQALQEALALDILYQDPPDLSLLAFDLATRLEHPTSYAAHYLALAESLDCPLWTADEQLYNAVRADFPRVRWLGDYPA